MKKEILKAITEPLFKDLFDFMKLSRINDSRMAELLGISRMEIYRWRKRKHYFKTLKNAKQFAVRLLTIKAKAYAEYIKMGGFELQLEEPITRSKGQKQCIALKNRSELSRNYLTAR